MWVSPFPSSTCSGMNARQLDNAELSLVSSSAVDVFELYTPGDGS